MNIVVLKSEEDLLLGDCDDSCVNGADCVCRTVFRLTNAGQGLYKYGIDRCVLCCRRDVQGSQFPYRVVVDGYPLEWVVNGMFIRFNKADYEVAGTRSITQVIRTGIALVESTWASRLYDTSVTRVPESSVRWFLSVCDSSDCKVPIHSYIDQHRAIGIRDSYMDLATDTVKCKSCDSALRFIHDKDGLVRFKGVTCSRCRFCSTIVRYKPTSAIQICTTCLEHQYSELKVIDRVCLHCKNTVSVNKRGGSQMLNVCKDGKTKEMYLCRHHKIKNLTDADVHDYSFIASHFE